MAKSKKQRQIEAVKRLDASMKKMASNWREQGEGLSSTFPLVADSLKFTAKLMEMYRAGLINIKEADANDQ